MIWDHVDRWLSQTPLTLLAVIVPLLMTLAVGAGMALRGVANRRDLAREAPAGEGLEGIIVSAVLGLLALLMGFTFSIVLGRYEDRRDLVLQEANAIGTVYLRAQLLEEPHRTRLSWRLLAYTDNRIALAEAPAGHTGELLARNDAMLTDIWAITAAAFRTIEDPGLSGQLLVSVNGLIDLDTDRKMARAVHVPPVVFVVLFVFLAIASAMLGYLSVGRRGKVALSLMVVLLSLVMLLILDVDRPTGGGIREDQAPMEMLRASLKAQPPAVFDRYRPEGQAPQPP